MFPDRYFINRTAHRILELSGGTLHQYLGNYDYYLEKNPNRALLQSPQPSALWLRLLPLQLLQKALPQKLSWQAQKEKEAQRRKRKMP